MAETADLLTQPRPGSYGRQNGAAKLFKEATGIALEVLFQVEACFFSLGLNERESPPENSPHQKRRMKNGSEICSFVTSPLKAAIHFF